MRTPEEIRYERDRRHKADAIALVIGTENAFISFAVSCPDAFRLFRRAHTPGTRR